MCAKERFEEYFLCIHFEISSRFRANRPPISETDGTFPSESRTIPAPISWITCAVSPMFLERMQGSPQHIYSLNLIGAATWFVNLSSLSNTPPSAALRYPGTSLCGTCKTVKSFG